jgi:hypothetical protein
MRIFYAVSNYDNNNDVEYNHTCITLSSLTLGLRLKEAWDLHQFQRAAEDELVWARDAEALLSTEDIGRDLQGVRFLLKKHQVS